MLYRQSLIPSGHPLYKMLEKIFGYLPKIELIAVGVTLVGVLLKVAQIAAFASFFMIFPLNILSILYFFRAIILPEDTLRSPIKSFVHKLINLGFCILCVGLLFKLMNWPGASTMMLAGTSTSVICLGVYALSLLVQKINIKFAKDDVVRLTVYSILIISLNLVPDKKLNEFLNNPELLETEIEQLDRIIDSTSQTPSHPYIR